MSKINVLRVADDIKSKTTIYVPLIEAIVNAIQAISESEENRNIWKIDVIFSRVSQLSLELENWKSEFYSVEIVDNWVWLNSKNLESFDTYRSDYKYKMWWKGFWRFMYIKYFDNVIVESTYKEWNDYKKINFEFWKKYNIVENPEIIDFYWTQTWTKILLKNIRNNHSFPKELETIAKVILEKLLVYFISYENLPEIKLIESDSKKEIILNKELKNSSEIEEIKTQDFKLECIQNKQKIEESFTVKIFKVFSPNNQKSKIILTADSREVTSTNLFEYVPEFEDDFIEDKKNYIIKAYILWSYLDKEVTIDRTGFNFIKEKDDIYPFSWSEIEEKAVEIIKNELSDNLEARSIKKQLKVKEYLKNNPHYKEYEEYINWDAIKMNPSDDHIEAELHKIKYINEKDAKLKINSYLKNFDNDIDTRIDDVFNQINKAKKSELAHYISLRKVFLDVLKKSLEIDDRKINHKKEDIVHSIIFPIKKDSDNTKFKDHNLWILDERLSFTEYLRSDMPLSQEEKWRPDIITFDQRVAYRWWNEATNPITIFEFKKPWRDDFYSDKQEDPKQQIIRYIEKIKEKKVRNYNDREIIVWENTPFYGYIIADFMEKTEKWLRQNQFKPLPNNREWVMYDEYYNLSLYFIDWEQLVKNAEQRNSTFFNYLWL